MSASLQRTPLFALHNELGARMVPFAGYEMPIQYSNGVMAEHNHTRSKAGLFDVSHMGQIRIAPANGDIHDAALALETLIPADYAGLSTYRQRYGLLTNQAGGILDDVMVAHLGNEFLVVVNAACKDADAAYFKAALATRCLVTCQFDRALLALQGPAAEAALAPLCPVSPSMRFMDMVETVIADIPVTLSRSGYTGEDGYEIGCVAHDADRLARLLLAQPDVVPIGLAARDSLRLEAGLCLYGQDIDTTTTPVEASLSWSIQKARRAGGLRQGGYPGADIVLKQMQDGVVRQRVGLMAEGRAPLRSGARLFADAEGKQSVGIITSGSFGPTVQAPVAMGYAETAYASVGSILFAELRGKFVPMHVQAMPFVKPGFKR